MANRTVYLPDGVERMLGDLDVNLSRLTQDAVRAAWESRDETEADRRREIIRRGAAALRHVEFVTLAEQRAEAGDEL